MKCPKCKKKMAKFIDEEKQIAVCCQNKSCWFYGIKRWHTTDEIDKIKEKESKKNKSKNKNKL